ncbi:hypothetical protein D9M69_568660 [compost metagenome]
MGLALAQGELGKAFLVFGHRRQYLGRRCQGRVLDLGHLGVQRLAVGIAAMALVEHSRQRGDFFQQLAGPFLQVDRLAIPLQLQARTTTFLDYAEEVRSRVATTGIGQQWAVIERAV